MTKTLLFVLVLLGALSFTRHSCAQVPRPVGLTRTERMLALKLADVSFNEALDSVADLEMITQTTYGAAHSPAERLRFLRNHSPCVTGRLTQQQAFDRPGNCRWTRNLSPSGDRPRGWEEFRDGPWDRMRSRWLAHLRRTIEYVRGTRVAQLCDETPESWDGKRYGPEQLAARGWRILPCSVETRNFAVVRAVRPAPPWDLSSLLGLLHGEEEAAQAPPHLSLR